MSPIPKPHHFIGSKMRGMLGYALKDEVCINPTLKCEGCFAAKECVFYEMYEKTNATHKYRLDFKLYNKQYVFSIYLFDALQSKEASIKKAMLKALDEYKTVEFKSKEKKFKKPKQGTSLLKLTFETPLRIKKQNTFARDDIELIDILRSAYKRNRDLKGKVHKPLKIDENYKIVSKHLHYKELTRRSNKQKTTMNMGGLMGEMIIMNVDKKVYGLLKLAEVIGVGKATVFGLGKIKIEEIV
jgi:CRISPR-associated endoribonuclease Cas6